MASATPPTLGSDVFWNISSSAKIHVPSAAAVTAYKAAVDWSDYSSMIVTP